MADEQPPDTSHRSLTDRVAERLRRELDALKPLVDEARATTRAKQARRAITRARQTGARLAHSPDEQLERIARRAIATSQRDGNHR